MAIKFNTALFDMVASSSQEIGQKIEDINRVLELMKEVQKYNRSVGFCGDHHGFLPVYPNGTTPKCEVDNWISSVEQCSRARSFIKGCSHNGNVVMKRFIISTKQRNFFETFVCDLEEIMRILNSKINRLKKEEEDNNEQ
jgi:hypothetical protein